jgi:hypothetical protein
MFSLLPSCSLTAVSIEVIGQVQADLSGWGEIDQLSTIPGDNDLGNAQPRVLEAADRSEIGAGGGVHRSGAASLTRFPPDFVQAPRHANQRHL